MAAVLTAGSSAALADYGFNISVVDGTYWNDLCGTSLTLDTNGRPHISYGSNAGLNYETTPEWRR